MFKITPVPSLPNGVKLILNGAQLAYWDIPQEFILTSEIVEAPFFISITFSKDSETKGVKFDVGKISGNRLDIKLINPHQLEPTATKSRTPLLILRDENIGLSFSMMLLSFADCDHVLFYYEFYEEPNEPEMQGNTQAEHSEAHK